MSKGLKNKSIEELEEILRRWHERARRNRTPCARMPRSTGPGIKAFDKLPEDLRIEAETLFQQYRSRHAERLKRNPRLLGLLVAGAIYEVKHGATRPSRYARTKQSRRKHGFKGQVEYYIRKKYEERRKADGLTPDPAERSKWLGVE